MTTLIILILKRFINLMKYYLYLVIQDVQLINDQHSKKFCREMICFQELDAEVEIKTVFNFSVTHLYLI